MRYDSADLKVLMECRAKAQQAISLEEQLEALILKAAEEAEKSAEQDKILVLTKHLTQAVSRQLRAVALNELLLANEAGNRIRRAMNMVPSDTIPE